MRAAFPSLPPPFLPKLTAIRASTNSTPISPAMVSPTTKVTALQFTSKPSAASASRRFIAFRLHRFANPSAGPRAPHKPPYRSDSSSSFSPIPAHDTIYFASENAYERKSLPHSHRRLLARRTLHFSCTRAAASHQPFPSLPIKSRSNRSHSTHGLEQLGRLRRSRSRICN